MEETSIGHQKYLVGGLPQGAVVVALIEQAGLGSAGLGRQRHDHRIAQRRQFPAQAGDKGGIRGSVLRKDKLKIHVKAPVSLRLQIVLDRLHQVILNRHIVEYQAGQLVGEAPLLCQRRKVHQGRDIQAVGSGNQGGIVQIN